MPSNEPDSSTEVVTPCRVVGIGASAGGFQPLRDLLARAERLGELGFFVLLHQDPHHESLAVGLLAASTSLRVVDARAGLDAVSPGTVYVVPPGMTLRAEDGRLALTGATTGEAPIDQLFRALANLYGVQAAGIVLSGSGSDGALGLKSIVAGGGLALVQSPDSAEFDSMPRAALQACPSARSLGIEPMPQALADWAAAGARDEPPPEASREGLRRVLEQVAARRGYDFSAYKEGMLLRRITRRMQLRDLPTLLDYAAWLEHQPEELDALFDDLLIGVTEFLRDPEAWDALQREVIEPVVRSKDDSETLRVWVAGTATGEEAYTLAMLFLDTMARANRRCQLQIFATDTDEKALAVARQGVYPAEVGHQVGHERMERYFTAIDNGTRVQVSAALRRHVIFGVQNLVSDPPFTGLDLVSCRNVLIYLRPDVQQRVLGMLHFALRPGGYLFVGKAETALTAEELFKPVASKARIFQRIGADAGMRTPFRLIQAVPGKPLAGFRSLPPASQNPQAGQVAQRVLVDRFAPASVLIDASLEVLYFSGPTEKYLAQPHGAPTHHLLSLLREGLRSRLRAALGEAVSAGAEVQVRHAQVKRDDGYVAVNCTVVPLAAAGMPAQYLVVFEDETAQPPAQLPAAAGEVSVVRNLERELAAARADLRATIEGLEGSNEELRIANEEVVSVNEELQTRNEELQSSKEELQSLNEELSAVNQQLQVKLGELEAANNDLNNLLNSSDTATLCIDSGDRIKWFSPAARDALQLVGGDVGRSVGLFAEPLMGASLLADVHAVAAAREPLQREVPGPGGRWYLRRTIPYRTEGASFQGVIVTMTDVTEGKLVQQAHEREARDEAQRLEGLVKERTRQLRAMSLELTRAEERERQSLAGDLHDDLLQTLIAAQLKLGEARTGGADAVGQAAELLDRATRSIRSLAYQLHPAVLMDQGLGAAIEWLAGDLRKTHGLQVRLDDDGRPKEVAPLTGAILFRVVRELLINVSKHARTSVAQVGMRSIGGKVEIRVTDQGAGFDPAELESRQERGLGLRSARERLAFIGGELRVQSTPGKGVTVTLLAPLGGAEGA